MIHSNRYNNKLNEDFFDDIETDEIIDSDIETSTQKNYNHTLNIHIGGGDCARDSKILQTLLSRFLKQTSLILDVIKSIKDFSEPKLWVLNTKEHDVVFFNLNDIPTLYKNRDVKLSTIGLSVDILSDFKNIRYVEKLLHSFFVSIESKTAEIGEKLYTTGIAIDKSGLGQQNHYIDRYAYQAQSGENFISKMMTVVSALIPSGYKPVEQLFKFYHVGYYNEIVEGLKGNHGKSVNICDQNNPPYPVGDIISNTTRLYKPGFIHGKDGVMEVHKDTNEIYCDYQSPEKDVSKIYEICTDAISQMIKENSKYQIHLVHGNGGPGALLFIFENTYAYKDTEYIVTVSYEFEAPIASYSISQEDMEKIREELMDEMGYSEEQVRRWFMNVNMHDDYFFKKAK